MAPADLIIVALVAVYIVDVSGFTEAWRGALARWLHVKDLRPLPPFDCGKCAAFWACIAWAASCGQLTLTTVALACALSLMATPIGQLMTAVRELLCKIIDKLYTL